MEQMGLNRAWGKSHLMLPPGALDLSSVNTQLAHLEQLFRTMPPERLYVRIPKGGPGSGAPRRISMADIPDLASRLAADEPLHLQAIDLQDYDPSFAAALRGFTQKVGAEIAEVLDPSTRLSTGLFLSTPGVVAPFHADFEHNFLAQVVGDKHMHLFPPSDLEIFDSLARERLACDTVHVLDNYQPSLEPKGSVAYLSPGSAIYHPPLGPHWVDTGKQSYSLSLSLSFITPSVTRTMMVHKLNRRLRKLGITPAPVGPMGQGDEMKYRVARALRSVVSGLRGGR